MPKQAGNAQSPGARRKGPAQRRVELLDCAVEISRTEGLAAVTLRRVADVLGVTPGLVSHYFSTVDQLVIETFREASNRDLADTLRVVEGFDSPRARVRALIDHVLGDPEAAAPWLDAWSMSRRDEVLASEVRDRMDEWNAPLARIVLAGNACGEFAAPDPEVAALRLITMIDGLCALRAVRFDSADEVKRIAYDYASAELRIADPLR